MHNIIFVVERYYFRECVYYIGAILLMNACVSLFVLRTDKKKKEKQAKNDCVFRIYKNYIN